MNLADRICPVFVYKPDWQRWPGICQPTWLINQDDLLNSGPISPYRVGGDTQNWWTSSVQMQLLGQILLRYSSIIFPCILSDYIWQIYTKIYLTKRYKALLSVGIRQQCWVSSKGLWPTNNSTLWVRPKEDRKGIPKPKQDVRGEKREKMEKLPNYLNISIPLRGDGDEGYGSLLVEFSREQWGKVGLFCED